jgi:hypothetical protein
MPQNERIGCPEPHSGIVETKEVDGWWRCSVCGLQFDEGTDRMVYIIEDATICEKCYNRGILWAIKESFREENKYA